MIVNAQLLLIFSGFFLNKWLRRFIALMNDVYVAGGNLDAAGVKANLSAFSELALRKKNVTIDMSAVESIDGSGVGALAFLYKRLRSSGHQVRLTKVRSQPLSVLEKLGLAELFSASSDHAFASARAAERATLSVSTAKSDLSRVNATP